MKSSVTNEEMTRPCLKLLREAYTRGRGGMLMSTHPRPDPALCWLCGWVPA